MDKLQETEELAASVNDDLLQLVKNFGDTHWNAHDKPGKMDPDCEVCVEFGDISLQLSGLSPEDQKESCEQYMEDGEAKESFKLMCDRIVERRTKGVKPVEQDLW